MSITGGIMRALQLRYYWSKRSASDERLSVESALRSVLRDPVHSSHAAARYWLHGYQKCPYSIANPMACTICWLYCHLSNVTVYISIWSIWSRIGIIHLRVATGLQFNCTEIDCLVRVCHSLFQDHQKIEYEAPLLHFATFVRIGVVPLSSHNGMHICWKFFLINNFWSYLHPI